VGVSAKVGERTKFNFAVVRALSHSVTGPNPLEVPGKQTIELKMDQWLFDLGLSFGF
jgi:long-chain fatty acid transport protein